jgi:hypothetical protein
MSRIFSDLDLAHALDFGWKNRFNPHTLKPRKTDFKLLKLQILRIVCDCFNYTTKADPPNPLVKRRIDSVIDWFFGLQKEASTAPLLRRFGQKKGGADRAALNRAIEGLTPSPVARRPWRAQVAYPA